MGKEATPRKLKANQSTATAKFVRVPPRKARLVLDAVRGKYVSDALAILRFVPNFAARAIEKVIKSAAANAENGRPLGDDGKPLPPLNTDNLKLVRAHVDEGPRLKRIQPRAQGRAFRILKRMSHITVVLEEAEPKPKKQRRPATRRARAATRPVPQPATPQKEAPVAVAEPEEVATTLEDRTPEDTQEVAQEQGTTAVGDTPEDSSEQAG